MEPKTDTPAPIDPKPGNWFDKLPPTTRGLLVAVGTLLANAVIAWAWTHVSPGTPAPVLTTPTVQSAPPPAVLVFNVGQPVQPPVSVAATK